ncbi:polysaccharide deacetylase family protein [Desulfovibrio sp. OttesenSCG-928-G15]|nr:polysaccharide deacetylase family protein [Desulfovibrio sp. OttesenSCG-928-G15]
MGLRKAGSVPVVIYHYVNNISAGLTVAPSLFEEHCRQLAESGWRGIGLEQAEAFFLHGEPVPPKSLLITFDDGYLDNYVYAWPILQKYGHKAVIFALTALMDTAQAMADLAGQRARPTLEDVWQGRVGMEDLPLVDAVISRSPAGYSVRNDLFFTWEEARRMERSGVVSVAAHSPGHEAVFTGPEFSGFEQPGNALGAFEHIVPGVFWGRPRFARASALTGRAFYPSGELLEGIRTMVPQDEPGAEAFFASEENRMALARFVGTFAENMGRLESVEEQKARLAGILQANQQALQAGLGHAVRSFCWPWGHHCDMARSVAQAAGFSVFYNVEPGPNPAGRPLGIRRMNYRERTAKMLSRLCLYSRPFLGELYKRCRV